jgi:pimeloyl-ACP methyl ester carboxylesterase
VPHPALTLTFVAAGTAVATVGVFMAYVAVRYAPVIGRIFEERPLFLPLRLPPLASGEEVRFTTADGLELGGTYFTATTPARVGVVVFCHEYLSDRWSFQPYVAGLREIGLDVFTFDFRNHGQSGSDPDYRPLQWASDHEVRDLRAALDYLRSRPDRDAAGAGLVGVSRGGSTALLVAASDPRVWGVVTDGAFPTRGTMLAYILRWAEIYVSNRFLWRGVPLFIFQFAGWVGRMRSERRLNCRFPDVERAVSRLAPRPWLMIHGGKDAYIGPDIARTLFAEGGEPKELWIVPKAKHNRCREIAPDEYAARLRDFVARSAPRRLAMKTLGATAAAETVLAESRSVEPSLPPSHEPEPTLAGEIVAPVGGVATAS